MAAKGTARPENCGDPLIQRATNPLELQSHATADALQIPNNYESRTCIPVFRVRVNLEALLFIIPENG